MNSWSSQATPTPQPRTIHHRHSTSSYASVLPQPMYHPLQHKRGSAATRTQTAGSTNNRGMRRVSSPDTGVSSLRKYPAVFTTRQAYY